MKNILSWLSQKTTLAGLVSLTVGASGAMGADWATNPDTAAVVVDTVPDLALTVLGFVNMFVFRE